MKEFGIIGGTGKQGNALATRLLRKGYAVRIGSRSQERGEQAAEELKRKYPASKVEGGTNEFSAEAEVIVIAIPIDQVSVLLEPLEKKIGEKIVFDMTVNLTFGKLVQTTDIDGVSSLEHVKTILPRAKVVTTLKTISFVLLKGEDQIDQTDFQITDSDEAFAMASTIAQSMGLQPIRIPNIEYAKTLEAMVALGIQLNKLYKGSHAGYKITNLKN